MAGRVVERDAVGAVESRDLGQDRSRHGVHDHDAVLAGDEQPVAGGIQGEVVPPAVAAQGDGPRDVVRLRVNGRGCDPEQQGASGKHFRQHVHVVPFQRRCSVRSDDLRRSVSQ